MDALVAVNNRLFGVTLDLLAVTQNIDHGDQDKGDQADHAEPGAGIQGHAGDGLGHGHGIGVQSGAHETDVLAQNDDGKAEHGIISHGYAQAHDQGDKAIELGQHTEGGAADGKDGHQNRNEEDFLFAQLFNQRTDTGMEGAGLNQNAEGTGAGEDDEDDIGSLDTAAVEGSEIGQQPGGGGFRGVDVVEGAVNGDISHGTVNVDLLVVIGSRRNDPGQDDHQKDDQGDDDISVWKLKFFLC